MPLIRKRLLKIKELHALYDISFTSPNPKHYKSWLFIIWIRNLFYIKIRISI